MNIPKPTPPKRPLVVQPVSKKAEKVVRKYERPAHLMVRPFAGLDKLIGGQS